MGMDRMRPNSLHKVWSDGRTAMNAWLALGSAYGAEIIAQLPYDAVTVDLQHGMFDFGAAISLFQAISTTAAVPMARIPANEPWMAEKVLDAGAYGVICPMISTADDCRRFVAACRYPPGGGRSFGPARGLLFGGRDYLQHANTTVLTWAMIETAQGVEKIDDIVAVPGLDAVYIGPSDLALDLGCPLSPEVHSDVRSAAKHLLKRAKAAEKRAGIFCPTPEFGREMAGLGFDLITVSNDAEMLRSAATSLLGLSRAQGTAVN
jgi:4-hydroxy-2-oxoheptanedioate aldolase